MVSPTPIGCIWRIETERHSKRPRLTYIQVEAPAGLGTVRYTDGRLVGRCRYRLTVFEQHSGDGAGGPIPGGLRRIQGRVFLEGDPSVTGDLILHLSDGRSLRFFFSNFGGKIEALGDLA